MELEKHEVGAKLSWTITEMEEDEDGAGWSWIRMDEDGDGAGLRWNT